MTAYFSDHHQGVNVATFSYGRVSTREQDVQNQRLEIERSGFVVDFWYADEGVSGKVSATQRPQFRELLDKIRDDERLVVAKLDRLGRDAMDIGATIKLLAAHRIEVIVLQLGKLDLGSAAGRMILTVLAAMAEMERDPSR
jgi:DNA invertase Pin-like site-specific DNA recombinase